MGKISKKKEISKDVLSLAKERIKIAFDRFDTVAVSFSGGKDSTACLNITLEEAKRRGIKKTPVFFFDEEAIPFETEDYVRRVAADPAVDLRWFCLPVRHRNGCSREEPWWFPWAKEAQEKWVRPLPPEAITELKGLPTKEQERITIPEAVGLLFDPRKDGSVGMVMGIRADESLTRTRAILSGRNRDDLHIIPWSDGTAKNKGLHKVYPIYDWKTADVWTAPQRFNWDYNTSYDVMTYAGISPSDQRCAPPYGEEPMLGLYQFSVCFPDIWGKMQRRVKGADTAARYSRTVLYSYNQRPQKPDDLSWQEFCTNWIEKHPDPYRQIIKERIKSEIKRHCEKTKDPILQTPHPSTGIGWDYLIMLAVRGDFKGRKQPAPASGVSKEAFLKAKIKYDQERMQMS